LFVAKTSKKSALDGWSRLGRRIAIVVRILLFRAEGRLTLVGIVLLALLTAGPYWAWKFVGPQLTSSDDYQLTADRVELVPPPDSVAWIRHDIKADALRGAALDGGARSVAGSLGSILDDDLCERIAKAIGMHPWIAEVERVTKRYPARVEVRVSYRRPAAMVVVSSDAWWPVDTTGVVLPRDDFSPNEARQYPQITGIAAGPFGPTGARWGDARVDEAAKIAAALADDWRRLALSRVAPLVVGTGNQGDEEFGYALYTERGRRIYWGRGPDHAAGGEPSTADKAARLRDYAKQHGSLDASTSDDLDLRGTRGIAPVPRSAEHRDAPPVLR
jgi:hypothetical protein